MRIKRFAAAVAALCLLVLSGCGGGDSNQLLAKIQDKGEITIALEGNWSPWGYHDENNKLVGYDVEIGEKLAEKLGVKVNFVESDWDSLLAGVSSGRFDMIINGVDVDETRQEKFELSTPYGYGRTVVIVRADDDSIQKMAKNYGSRPRNHGVSLRRL